MKDPNAVAECNGFIHLGYYYKVTTLYPDVGRSKS